MSMTAEQKAAFTARMKAARAAKAAGATAAPTEAAPKAPEKPAATAAKPAAPAVHTEPASAPSKGLSEAQLRKLVPAAYATHAAKSTSEQYQFVSTAELINRLGKEGFVPVRAVQNNARSEEGNSTTRHMIRFRRSDAPRIVGEVFPEVMIINGHNGAVKFQMCGGLYRMVCSNGLVVSVPGQSTRATTRHIGDTLAIVEDAFKMSVATANLASDRVAAMMDAKLSAEDTQRFARLAASMAFGETHSLAKEPAPLLVPRRAEDDKQDLWHVLNRIQENTMRGGVPYVSAGGRAVHTKGITRVKRDIGFNMALWDLAEDFLRGERPADELLG